MHVHVVHVTCLLYDMCMSTGYATPFRAAGPAAGPAGPAGPAWVDETMARLLKAPCLHAWQHSHRLLQAEVVARRLLEGDNRGGQRCRPYTQNKIELESFFSPSLSTVHAHEARLGCRETRRARPTGRKIPARGWWIQGTKCHQIPVSGCS